MGRFMLPRICGVNESGGNGSTLRVVRVPGLTGTHWNAKPNSTPGGMTTISIAHI
jgi:hypothetical protein